MDLRYGDPIMKKISLSYVWRLSIMCGVLLSTQLQAQTLRSTQVLTPTQEQVISVDRVYMIVDGIPVLNSDIERRMVNQAIIMKQDNLAIPPRYQLREYVTQRTIFETAVFKRAQDRGFAVDEAELNRLRDIYVLRSGKTKDAFFADLQRNGVSEAQFMKDLAFERAVEVLKNAEVTQKIKVSESEIDQMVKDPRSGAKAEWLLSHIVLRKGESEASTTAAIKKADAVRSAIKAGKPFDEVVKQFSEGDDAKTGGSLGWRSADKLPAAYSSIVNALSAGEVSDLIETSNGLFVVKLQGRRQINNSVTQTRARHILLASDALQDETRTVSEIKRLHQLLTLNIDRFPALAAEYGQDATAGKGGDLGWTMPGEMVTEFDKAMSLLRVGELGEPVRTNFGWHVLQVLERENRPIPNEKLRNSLRNFAYEEKREAATQDWQNEVMQQAFVEYKKIE